MKITHRGISYLDSPRGWLVLVEDSEEVLEFFLDQGLTREDWLSSLPLAGANLKGQLDILKERAEKIAAKAAEKEASKTRSVATRGSRNGYSLWAQFEAEYTRVKLARREAEKQS